jgi:hypothetical protein
MTVATIIISSNSNNYNLSKEEIAAIKAQL